MTYLAKGQTGFVGTLKKDSYYRWYCLNFIIHSIYIIQSVTKTNFSFWKI